MHLLVTQMCELILTHTCMQVGGHKSHCFNYFILTNLFWRCLVLVLLIEASGN